MANIKISQLPILGVLHSQDIFPVVSAGITFNVSADVMQTFMANVPGTLIVNNSNQPVAIFNSGLDGVGNIGTPTNRFNTIFAKATSAEYADLAECYTADDQYESGTVMSIGGTAEITVSVQDADTAVVGVISTNPAHVMNADIDKKNKATVALVGRVPCLVEGPVNRGQMLVSAGNGRARAEPNPALGTVIGKALQNHAGGPGMIEIIVGKM
jgi:hypothetical protein